MTLGSPTVDARPLQVKAAETKRKLETAAVRYRRQKDSTRTQVGQLVSKAEARKQQLHENELFAALEKLETKMRSMEQSIFQMTVCAPPRGEGMGPVGVAAG